MDQDISPVHLTSIHLAIRAAPLAFSPATTDAIAAYWVERSAGNPALFNGSAFLFDHFAIDPDAGTLAAKGAPTDFATFLYWRHHRDDLPLSHAFPVGALVTADDKLIIGRMSQHTANAGKVYPPAGSFDANDLIPDADGGGTLDPIANIAREIGEEIGLDIGRLTAEPGWLLLPSSPRAYAFIKIFRMTETSADVGPDLRRHIAEDPHQELEDVLFVDFATRFEPETVSPYVNHLLAYLEAKG